MNKRNILALGLILAIAIGTAMALSTGPKSIAGTALGAGYYPSAKPVAPTSGEDTLAGETNECSNLYALTDQAMRANDSAIIDTYNVLLRVQKGDYSDGTKRELDVAISEQQSASDLMTSATALIDPCGSNMDPNFRTVSGSTAMTASHAYDQMTAVLEAGQNGSATSYDAEMSVLREYTLAWKSAYDDYLAMRAEM